MAKAVWLKDKNDNKVFAAPWVPIGSIYLSVNNTNPSNYFGGTWEALPQDYYLMTAPIKQTNIGRGGSWYTNETVLTIDQIPAHNHNMQKRYAKQVDWNMDYPDAIHYSGDWYNTYGVVSTATVGGGKGHNHKYQPPYYQVYAWKRVS